MAAPRSFSSNAAPMSASEQGMSSAAPTPWTTRAAIRTSAFAARPQPSEAAAKMLTPITKISRRPNRSAAAPPTSSRADMHSV